jgi:hypothetical protein
MAVIEWGAGIERSLLNILINAIVRVILKRNFPSNAPGCVNANDPREAVEVKKTYVTSI